MILGAPTPALANCGLAVDVAGRLEQAQGTVFLGTLVESETVEPPLRVALTWSIEETYVGAPLEPSTRIIVRPCSGIIPLQPGSRYLVSTSDVIDPEDHESLVWRVDDRGRLGRLIREGCPGRIDRGP